RVELSCGSAGRVVAGARPARQDRAGQPIDCRKERTEVGAGLGSLPELGTGMANIHSHKEIQLQQMRSFCTVANEGSFTAAAKLLDVSLSALWQQVRDLEHELKTPLLRRQGRKIRLTSKGRLFWELVQGPVQDLDSLIQRFKMERAGLPRVLTV